MNEENDHKIELSANNNIINEPCEIKKNIIFCI